MYKLFFALSVFVSLFFTYSFASISPLDGLSVNFCSGSNDSMVVMPGEKKSLCLQINNITTGDIKIKFNFSESTFAIEGNQVCADDVADNKFAKLFMFDNSKIYNIPALSSIIQEFPFSIPAWLKGNQYGCVIYRGVGDVVGGVGLFSMDIRQGKPMSVMVLDKNGELKTSVKQNFSMSIGTGGNIFVTADFVNDSDFEESIVFTGTVSNVLGFQRDFSQDLILKVGEKKSISINLGKVPSYRGLFSLSVDGFYVPYFGSANIDLPAKYKETVSFVDSATLFSFAYIQLIALAIIILLVYMMFRKRKVVVVQSVIQTPVSSI